MIKIILRNLKVIFILPKEKIVMMCEDGLLYMFHSSIPKIQGEKVVKNSILKYLERSADRFPDKVAVIDEFGQVTYQELLQLSKKIGTGLSDKVTIGKPVAVLMEKSTKALAAFLGIVQAGGFYVLVNPDLPEQRIWQIQNVLQAKYWITDSEHMELAKTFMPQDSILNVENLADTEINEEILEHIRGRFTDVNPLYANFTSGSTGVPKGVLVSHRSVIDFIDIFADNFGIDDTDIIANQAPFDFDVSVKDIYSALSKGATLVIVPKRLFSAPTQLIDFLCEQKITTMIWAVSAICLISTFHGLEYKTPETVKRVLFSGEEMPLKHLKNWREHLPETMFVNLYGPTEITCNCTYHILEKGREYADGIPIGKAFANEDVFLLDENNQLIAKQEKDKIGEVCVRGTALALGYYRNAEQTSQAFCQNPLNDCYPERIYRTGDLAKYTEENDLMFCGRKDFQIKYLGHRIELEEVERAISSVDGVERAIVLFDHAKHKLYGFYVGTMDKKELHAGLKEFLPIFMIPGILVPVEEFPLTKNGKVDRKALLEMRKRK